MIPDKILNEAMRMIDTGHTRPHLREFAKQVQADCDPDRIVDFWYKTHQRKKEEDRGTPRKIGDFGGLRL